jgi:aminodeoxyfutalosine deaminase
MAIYKISAPLIFDGYVFHNNKVIILDENEVILGLDDLELHEPSTIKKYPYAIGPGFVNTHCHLELSHMKNLVDTGTTLIPFITNVVKFRDFKQHIIDAAIEEQDKAMYDSGIVAVGDISNKADTVGIKNRSKIKYYTFVELFDLMNQAMLQGTIDQYTSVYDKHEESSKNNKSFSPHAPYSVTKKLFEYIKTSNKPNKTISIHNQETNAENLLFLSKSGDFIDFYSSFGNNLENFTATGKTSIHYAIEHMDPLQKTLFVHNTLTRQADIKAANDWSKDIYWATCPNANLYIENNLPDYSIFIKENQKMTIGTDSLTSNWQLSIWEEIKTIRKYCSYVPLQSLLQWATINGADALNFSDSLGSIEVGKKPGLVSMPIILNEGKPVIINGNSERVVAI